MKYADIYNTKINKYIHKIIESLQCQSKFLVFLVATSSFKIEKEML